MCAPALLAALGTGGAATAAGATAAATTAASSLSTIGTILSVGGAVIEGVQGMRAAKANAAAIEDQRRTEAQLTAVQDGRSRKKMARDIAVQRAELAARGVQLDSVTAMMLGQTAAQEMSFESQAVRTGGAARDRELSAEARAQRAMGAQSLLKGVFSAAGDLVKGAPDLWPGFMREQTP